METSVIGKYSALSKPTITPIRVTDKIWQGRHRKMHASTYAELCGMPVVYDCTNWILKQMSILNSTPGFETTCLLPRPASPI